MIKVLCVGGKTQSEGHCLPADDHGLKFSLKHHLVKDGKSQGVSESDIIESDVLLLSLAGSGWDWFEHLQLPQSAITQRPTVAILDKYDERFALSLLKLGIGEVVPSSDCNPAKLQYSILAAITRFQRSSQASTDNKASGISAHEQAAFKALDTLPFGIIFADKDSKVMFMNSAAKKVCTNGSGVYISKDKRCCAVDPDESVAMHRLIDKMSHEVERGDDENHTLKITGDDGSTVTMLVVSVGKKSEEHGVAIFIDSGGGFFNISEETLKSVYGLTQSESELLLRMVQGETLAEISEARSVTMHTVRAQLKSLFAKTDTNRQASLIKKVLTGPAVLMQR